MFKDIYPQEKEEKKNKTKRGTCEVCGTFGSVKRSKLTERIVCSICERQEKDGRHHPFFF